MNPELTLLAIAWVFGGLAGNLTNTVASNPEFISYVSSYSSWLGSHTVAFGWIATGVICGFFVVLPMVMISRDRRYDENHVAAIHDVAYSVGSSFVRFFFGTVFLLIGLSCVAYLGNMLLFLVKNS